ncbi:BMP family ABC transporter substrate-binding protein [Amycolatopsis sp. NPDC001319]|uniref:BMP family ABC transporter substrate-binding protein n=1 Tax=unclassified Amycolatopsis TaxID=2618356 RepID=UPI00367BF1C8
MRRRWWVAAAVVVVGVFAAVVFWPAGKGDDLPPPRARVYADFAMCLLTGPQGLAEPGVGQVWDGMQDASAATKAKVSYLAAAGAKSEAAYLPYLNSLLQRRCNVIVTTGSTANAVAAQQASGHPQVRFVAVGGTAARDLVVVKADGGRDAVAKAVVEAARDVGFG